MTSRLLAVAILASFLLGSCAEESGPPPAPPSPPPVTVAHPIQTELVEWDRYTGRLAAVEEVQIQARVSGYLDSLHFTDGQLVEEGDLLAVIDPRPFEAELARVRALLEEARARKTQAQALDGQARAQLTSANSARDLSQSRLSNAEQAFATNAIAREQVDVRKNELAQAQAEVEAAKAAVALAQAEIATAEASIVSAQAAVDQADLELTYTRVVAPISGRISDVEVTRGNFVQGGNLVSTALTTIVSMDPIHVEFDANEQAFLKYVRLAADGERLSSRDTKNPVRMALVDEEGYPHSGHMDFVDNRIDPNTGTIRGRAIFRNPSGVLTPGLFATVRLPGSARKLTILLPDEAILANQATRYVLVLDENDAAAVRPVTLGPKIDGMRVLRAGLDGSERVIVNGLQRVRPGSVVAPTLVELELVEQDDGLPNDYEPVPEEDWILPRRAPGTGDPADAAAGDGE